MIYTYGVTLQGAYHIQNDITCQDAHKIVKCGNALAIAAVADGLGSSKHSDVASKMAVELASDFCRQNIKQESKENEIPAIIRASFLAAHKAIEAEAKTQGRHIEHYDTTLSLVVLHNDILFYGHSGDSGILALTTDGLYEKVTEQQRDKVGHVFPLVAEDKWVFEQFGNKVHSVLLATDGILEILCPTLLKNKPVSINVNIAELFLDNRVLKIDSKGEVAARDRIIRFLNKIPAENVNDDKTVVGLLNVAVKSGSL